MRKIDVGDIAVKWQVVENTIEFEVFAPTKGWVALGFNTKNDIVGTNLIMGAAINNKSVIEEQYVTGVGVHKNIALLGGTGVITNFSCSENEKGTTLKFSMPKTLANDSFHYPLTIGKSIWLICAYSAEDDFNHHSRMRKYIEVVL